jgi:Spy/CpxP family protein refolding chaperone
MKTRNMALAVLFGCSALSSAALAADSPKDSTATSNDSMATPPTAMDEETQNKAKDARVKALTETKDQLQKALGTGKDKAFYRQKLEQMGYGITAINSDDPDYLEYEVVKPG